jgi:glycosyltransferase involved in cell wall biosynthesis
LFEPLLCGDGITWANRDLAGWIEAKGLQTRCHLLGRRQDVPRITAALDVACSSSSYGEAWPLTIGEAMACGVPCVVTDVGDSALIVGETGRVVPPKSPEALANAWEEILTLDPHERARLGMTARRRIEDRFDLSDAVAHYERLYAELVGRNGHNKD